MSGGDFTEVAWDSDQKTDKLIKGLFKNYAKNQPISGSEKRRKTTKDLNHSIPSKKQKLSSDRISNQVSGKKIKVSRSSPSTKKVNQRNKYKNFEGKLKENKQNAEHEDHKNNDSIPKATTTNGKPTIPKKPEKIKRANSASKQNLRQQDHENGETIQQASAAAAKPKREPTTPKKTKKVKQATSNSKQTTGQLDHENNETTQEPSVFTTLTKRAPTTPKQKKKLKRAALDSKQNQDHENNDDVPESSASTSEPTAPKKKKKLKRAASDSTIDGKEDAPVESPKAKKGNKKIKMDENESDEKPESDDESLNEKSNKKNKKRKTKAKKNKYKHLAGKAKFITDTDSENDDQSSQKIQKLSKVEEELDLNCQPKDVTMNQTLSPKDVSVKKAKKVKCKIDPKKTDFKEKLQQDKAKDSSSPEIVNGKLSKSTVGTNKQVKSRSSSDDKDMNEESLDKVTKMQRKKKKQKAKQNAETIKEETATQQISKPIPQQNTPKPNARSPFNISKLKTVLSKSTEEAKTQSTPKAALSLRDQMLNQLKAARFRHLNEQLYTTTGDEAYEMFQDDPDAFTVYHEGFQSQVTKWPENPLDIMAQIIKARPKSLVVADFGCGDANLALKVPQKVHSFDLVALNPRVTACDMANVPLADSSTDISVFCLSLMGTNLAEYVAEAHRVLKDGGTLLVAEVVSRFENNIGSFVRKIQRMGFEPIKKDATNKMFVWFEFKKAGKISNKNHLPSLELKPCVYKKR